MRLKLRAVVVGRGPRRPPTGGLLVSASRVVARVDSWIHGYLRMHKTCLTRARWANIESQFVPVLYETRCETGLTCAAGARLGLR